MTCCSRVRPLCELSIVKSKLGEHYVTRPSRFANVYMQRTKKTASEINTEKVIELSSKRLRRYE